MGGTGIELRMGILRDAAAEQLLKAFRTLGWDASVSSENQSGEYLIVTAIKSGATRKVALMYSSATSNAHYKTLDALVDHIFTNGALYHIEQYAYGIKTPVTPVDEFFPTLVAWNKELTPPTKLPVRELILMVAALRPGGPDVVRFAEANQFAITRVERLEKSSIHAADRFIFLKVSADLRAEFGLEGDELLLVFLANREQGQWFVGETRRKLTQEARLAKSAVLIISPDPHIVRLCARASADLTAGYKSAFVGISLDALSATTDAQSRQALLRRVFREQAFVVDHFDARNPVPDDLFGRMQLIAQVEHDMRSSGQGVAILGIRRVGKTSILKRVLSQLEATQGEQWLVGLYDAQQDTVSATTDTTLSKLLRYLRLKAKDAGIEVVPPVKGLDILDQFRFQVHNLIHVQGCSVALAIDEIEWLVPTTASAAQSTARDMDFIRLFGFLRSLKQEYSGHLSLLLCGINESLCELPRIGGMPNPNLDWYRPHYVGMLPRQDADDMLRQLGSRMGLAINDEFLDGVWDAFGGHPYLARQFCSEAARSVIERPAELTQQVFVTTIERFASVRAKTILEEVLQHLAQFYPQEYDCLRALATDGNSGPVPVAEIAHLRNYGLLTEDEQHRPKFTMSAMAKFVRGRPTEDIRRTRFQFLTPLGQGVTGAVWKALDLDTNELCAVKIYTTEGGGPSDEQIAKIEFQLLQAIASPHVPRPIAVMTHAGTWVLAQELVRGEPLEMILVRQGRILGNDLALLSHNLCSALDTIHPNVERIATLKKQGELTTLEYLELSTLLEQGYLHRDLKPANIMVTDARTWEVKLIDFGLSTPATRANRTKVGTPAYLPPDWGIQKWDPTFDLYAVGRILQRCVFGALVDFDDLETKIDALALSDPGYKKAVFDFFVRAVNPSASARFRSVAALREGWDGALLALL